MWRFARRGSPRQGYPAKTLDMFHGLPKSGKVDAVYERPNDNSLVFFIGDQFWVTSDGITFQKPRSLHELGISRKVNRLDAAFVWGKNGRTYLFSNNLYWKLNDHENEVEPGYPKDISNWRELSTRGIDGVITSPFDGKNWSIVKQNGWQRNFANFHHPFRFYILFPPEPILEIQRRHGGSRVWLPKKSTGFLVSLLSNEQQDDHSSETILKPQNDRHGHFYHNK